MAYIPHEKMMVNKTSLYKLVLATAQRANELNLGARALVEPKNKKPTTISMEEFSENKVRYILKTDKKEKE
jgi:DNA-directed RNA polymerase omega subunit